MCLFCIGFGWRLQSSSTRSTDRSNGVLGFVIDVADCVLSVHVLRPIISHGCFCGLASSRRPVLYLVYRSLFRKLCGSCLSIVTLRFANANIHSAVCCLFGIGGRWSVSPCYLDGWWDLLLVCVLECGGISVCSFGFSQLQVLVWPQICWNLFCQKGGRVLALPFWFLQFCGWAFRLWFWLVICWLRCLSPSFHVCYGLMVCTFSALVDSCSLLSKGWVRVGPPSSYYLLMAVVLKFFGFSMMEVTFLGLGSGFFWCWFSNDFRGSQWRMGVTRLEFCPISMLVVFILGLEFWFWGC